MSRNGQPRPVSVHSFGKVLGEPPQDAQIALAYVDTDPYAVIVTVTVPGKAPATLLLGRDLLADGMLAPSGDGDVTVACRGRRVHLTLRDRRGEAVVVLRARALARFLRDTYRCVPAGTESQHVDVDRLLAGMLAE